MTTKERPIIFDRDSVRAILAGKKTQTRRVVTPQPEETFPGADIWMLSGKAVTDEYINPVIGSDTLVDHYWHNVDSISPYGGGEYMDGTFDRLWVRERWMIEQRGDMRLLGYAADTGAPWLRNVAHIEASAKYVTAQGGYRSPIHMPRWASRITLEVATVRVERLQEISDEDCEAEIGGKAFPAKDSARFLFLKRWDDINAKRGYPLAANPWVWVITFKRVAE